MTIPDLITKLRRKAETRATYAGELLGEAADTIEDLDKLLQQAEARVAELEQELAGLRSYAGADLKPPFVEIIPTEGMRRNAVFEKYEPPAARLDRIEAWLRGTHGYPYPGKD
jgi:proline dehydrogenase